MKYTKKGVFKQFWLSCIEKNVPFEVYRIDN